MKRTLKEIALDLLNQYEIAETTVIGEFSVNIVKSMKQLGAEVEAYRDEIENAEPEQKKGKWIKTDESDEWYGRMYKCSVCGCFTTS